MYASEHTKPGRVHNFTSLCWPKTKREGAGTRKEMSDFFSGIYSGIKRPDVVMNDGPLPPLSTSGGGYPVGFNGAPDGKINYANSLLGDLDPYAYGEPARLSTQTAYLNIPHVAQRIIPSIELPESQPFKMGGGFFKLSHQVGIASSNVYKDIQIFSDLFDYVLGAGWTKLFFICMWVLCGYYG